LTPAAINLIDRPYTYIKKDSCVHDLTGRNGNKVTFLEIVETVIHIDMRLRPLVLV
jgi:hypothetical protein